METPTQHKKLKPWDVGWWMPNFGDQDRKCSVERIAAGSTPGPSYYVLLLLSTLIASYGLLSNSTATVIGAMIVAPLMGPIMGLAMGIVTGDNRMFQRSLVAEISGVIVVILTALFVAQITGVEQIDFTASEIANRTRPTLFDLAIGLAAGLAGAFCMVHPGLQASVAGVAIAVALVPPLAVTGITTAGWLHGQLNYWPAFGSFMLFFANFLTIELAAGLLFYLTGFRVHRTDFQPAAFRRAIIIQLILLLLTGLFLTQQLRSLVRERVGLATARQVLNSSLQDIPGADLDSLSAELRGNSLEVVAAVGSRTDIAPSQVSIMETRIQKGLDKQLKGVAVRLVVRTINSTYASSHGLLYEPKSVGPNPEQVRGQLLDKTIRDLLAQYPSVELSILRRLPTGGQDEDAVSKDAINVELTVDSPYVFSPRMVAELQKNLNEALAKLPEFDGRTAKLLVRTITVQSVTADDLLTIAAPGTKATQDQQQLNALMNSLAKDLTDQEIIQISLRPIGDPQTTDHYLATMQTRGANLLDDSSVRDWGDKVVRLYSEAFHKTFVLDLEVVSELGRRIRVSSSEPTTTEKGTSQETPPELSDQTLTQELTSLVKSEGRGTVDPASVAIVRDADGANIRIEATVVTPKLLTNQQVLKWQKSIKAKHPKLKSLELKLDNRLGQSLRMLPSRD